MNTSIFYDNLVLDETESKVLLQEGNWKCNYYKVRGISIVCL
jgi:hypothetical protein